jgi:hypothetical protein
MDFAFFFLAAFAGGVLLYFGFDIVRVSHICRSKTSIPLLAHYPDTVDAPSVGW